MGAFMDGFRFDLQLFGETTFPAEGYYELSEAGLINTMSNGVDVLNPGSADHEKYLHVESESQWSIVAFVDGTLQTVKDFDRDLILDGLVGTEDYWKVVVIPEKVEGLAKGKKVICADVDSYVSVNGLTDGATVQTLLNLNNAAITVNNVAFTGVNSGCGGGAYEYENQGNAAVSHKTVRFAGCFLHWYNGTG